MDTLPINCKYIFYIFYEDTKSEVLVSTLGLNLLLRYSRATLKYQFLFCEVCCKVQVTILAWQQLHNSTSSPPLSVKLFFKLSLSSHVPT